jgi:hypothetical protein
MKFSFLDIVTKPWIILVSHTKGGMIEFSYFCLCSSRTRELLISQLMRQWLQTPLLLSFSPHWWVVAFLVLRFSV